MQLLGVLAEIKKRRNQDYTDDPPAKRVALPAKLDCAQK